MKFVSFFWFSTKKKSCKISGKRMFIITLLLNHFETETKKKKKLSRKVIINNSARISSLTRVKFSFFSLNVSSQPIRLNNRSPDSLSLFDAVSVIELQSIYHCLCLFTPKIVYNQLCTVVLSRSLYKDRYFFFCFQ